MGRELIALSRWVVFDQLTPTCKTTNKQGKGSCLTNGKRADYASFVGCCTHVLTLWGGGIRSSPIFSTPPSQSQILVESQRL